MRLALSMSMSRLARLVGAPPSFPTPVAAAVPRPRPQLISLPTAVLEDLPQAPPSVPPPLPSHRELRRSDRVPVAQRLSGDDVIEALFEAFRDLAFEPDALSAARFCLEALDGVIPCRASIAHVFDMSRRDFLVVQARGEAAEAMVLGRHSASDPLLSAAMPTGEPLVWSNPRGVQAAGLDRFAELDGVKTVLACPVVSGPRWLGAIELVDPIHGARFRKEDILGARYASSRYADFLASHGVVVDVATVARFAFAS